jgi:hypothetical protein
MTTDSVILGNAMLWLWAANSNILTLIMDLIFLTAELEMSSNTEPGQVPIYFKNKTSLRSYNVALFAKFWAQERSFTWNICGHNLLPFKMSAGTVNCKPRSPNLQLKYKSL